MTKSSITRSAQVLDEFLAWLMEEIDSADQSSAVFAKRAHAATDPATAVRAREEASAADHRAQVLRDVRDALRINRRKAVCAERDEGEARPLAKVLRLVPRARDTKDS